MQQDNELVAKLVNNGVIPKRAFTKPAWWAVVVFILITIASSVMCIVCNGYGIIALIEILPILMGAGLVFSYFFGLAISKKAASSNRLSLRQVYIILFLVQIACIVVSIICEVLIKGYPIKECIATCRVVNPGSIVFVNIVMSLILFIPACYVAYRYHRWTIKYNQILAQQKVANKKVS